MATNLQTSRWLPPPRRTLFFGIMAGCCLFAAPLLYDQFPRPRAGLIWYPIFVALLSYLLAWAMDRLSAWQRPHRPHRPPYYEIGLVAAGCLGAGHFVTWFATIGPELLGVNAWRGNVLVINLVTALLGLVSALWAAFSLRLLVRRSTIRAGPGIVLVGAIIVFALWLAWENANGTVWASSMGYAAPFWEVLSELGTGSRPEYVVYAFLESFYWQAAWPLLMLAALIGAASAKPRARTL